MASTTAAVTLPSNEAWTLIATAPTNALVQLRTEGPVEVAAATAPPAGAAAVEGVMLTGDQREFSAADLGATTNVYGRSRNGTEETVAVIYGDNS